jgi:hypothetical protein
MELVRSTTLLSVVPFALTCVIALGCESSSGGQTGEEAARCAVVDETDLAPGEQSPLGFGGDAIGALTADAQVSELSWAKGGTTALTVSFSASGPATYRRQKYVDDGSDIEIAVGCSDVVAQKGSLSFQTDDGGFDESWPVTLTAADASNASVVIDLDLDHLGGSYVVTEVDPSAFDGIQAYVTIDFGASGAHGSVDGTAAGKPQGGKNGTVSAQHFAIASF